MFGDFEVDCLSMVPLLGKILSSLYGKHQKGTYEKIRQVFYRQIWRNLELKLSITIYISGDRRQESGVRRQKKEVRRQESGERRQETEVRR